ncbi:S24 family peptidase [Tundrisphaera sp. TA3]|uniref:S24 family peptidase n=1 Tax=Tundrisphaera sp. TA3 TaxID=3435775 RepID=UPI003EBF0472
MARRKNAPESVKVKHGLSERLREIRTELFGERGGPDLARRLEIPVRTWYNYETGVTVPAEIILRIVELTSVEPIWLLRGEGPKFRARADESNPGSNPMLEESSVPALLRAALHRLEQAQRQPLPMQHAPPMVLPRDGREADGEEDDLSLVGGDRVSMDPLTPADGTSYAAARREWQDARRSLRHLRVADASMTPIVAEEAIVAYAEAEPISEMLDGKLVVAKIDGQEYVRWFQHCGRYALLRAENPATDPPTILVDPSAEGDSAYHRVLWISTPH